MTKTIDVVIPRANTNDDQARVVEVCVENGQRVSEGDLLFTIETTKSTIDIEAEVTGVIRDLSLAVDGVVSVGQVVASLWVEGVVEAAGRPPSPGPDASVTGQWRITARGRKRAKQLGIKLEDLEASGVIDVASVERYFAQQQSSKAPDQDLPHFDRSDYLGRLEGREAIVFGGGGHSAVVMDALAQLGVSVVGAIDDVLDLGTEVLPGRHVVERVARLADFLYSPDSEVPRLAFVGVGGQTDNRPRERVVNLLQETGFELPPLVHPSAIIGEAVSIGAATCVLAGSVIGPRCRVGTGVIVNQAAQLCHDGQVADFAHLAPGALVAGWCGIGRRTTVGMGATVMDHIKLGEECLVHNGAAVTGTLADGQELSRGGERRRRVYGG